jgi:hypothetical protein
MTAQVQRILEGTNRTPGAAGPAIASYVIAEHRPARTGEQHHAHG